MPTGQMISLGIGSPASINVLDLTGLFPSQVATNQATGAISIGPAAGLTANVIYALPARKVNIEWQSTIATNLDISLDGTTWVTVDSSAGADLRQITVAALFLRPSANVTVILRKVKAKL